MIERLLAEPFGPVNLAAVVLILWRMKRIESDFTAFRDFVTRHLIEHSGK